MADVNVAESLAAEARALVASGAVQVRPPVACRRHRGDRRVAEP
jgi:hypothetical protein